MTELLTLILAITIAIVGGFWAIIQFYYNRKYQKNDKLQERRHEIYSKFMLQLSKTPSINLDDMESILKSSNEEELKKSLMIFNNNIHVILDGYKKINSILTEMNLISGYELSLEINEYRNKIESSIYHIENCIIESDLISIINNGEEIKYTDILSTDCEVLTQDCMLKEGIICQMRFDIGTQKDRIINRFKKWYKYIYYYEFKGDVFY